MVSVHTEVERKYAADDGFELPPLTDLVAGTGWAEPGDRPGRRGRAGAASAGGDVLRHRRPPAGRGRADPAPADRRGRRRLAPEGPGRVDARSEVRLPLGRATRTVPAPLQNMVWVRTGAPPCARSPRSSPSARCGGWSTRPGTCWPRWPTTASRPGGCCPPDGSGDAAGAATSWREIEVELADGDGDLLRPSTPASAIAASEAPLLEAGARPRRRSRATQRPGRAAGS